MPDGCLAVLNKGCFLVRNISMVSDRSLRTDQPPAQYSKAIQAAGGFVGELSIWHWLLVLVVVMMVFGTRKLRTLGQDLGGAVKGFKEAMRGGEAEAPRQLQQVEATPGPAVQASAADKVQH